MHIRGGALSLLHSLTYYRPTVLSLDRSGRADEAEEEEEEEEDEEEARIPFYQSAGYIPCPCPCPLT